MTTPRASLRIHGAQAERVEQAIDTLYAIESAYNPLCVANAQIDGLIESAELKRIEDQNSDTN
ncbi:MAG TPA: hypothetical protein DIT97_06240 [Gimesia maris]|uniref:Uncharacterized protein n=1 Tax=Gimesia maris TaxID=122 RepID=A0A3D3R4X5_9PLAN|nr:hypothetical protein [Gimesia maris]|tara:strand:+ start:3149 stop:3337 length:189 start_codon:yes stop_codon:yes gene_type:complete